MIDPKLFSGLNSQLNAFEKEYQRVNAEVEKLVSERSRLKTWIETTRELLSGKGSKPKQGIQKELIMLSRSSTPMIPLTRRGRSSPVGDACAQVLKDCTMPVPLDFVFSKLVEQKFKTGTKANVWLALKRLSDKGIVEKKEGLYVLKIYS